jgi:hypothetical protein
LRHSAGRKHVMTQRNASYTPSTVRAAQSRRAGFSEAQALIGFAAPPPPAKE